MEKKKVTLLWIIVSCGFVSFCYPFFKFINTSLARDWDYFNALSLLNRSSLWVYHQLPLHDPWILGGMDILANPQSRSFSPLLLLDFLFIPRFANLLGMMIYGTLGLFGFYLLLRHFKIHKWIALTCGFVYVNGSWFGLHFAEGHMAYAGAQLFPFVLLSVFNLEKKSYRFLLFSLLSLFLLDGHIYVFAFSLLVMFGGLVVNWTHSKKHLKKLFDIPPVAMFVCFAMTKVYPFSFFGDMPDPIQDAHPYPLGFLFTALFDPIQTIIKEVPSHLPYHFHEYGFYLGVVLVGIIFYQVRLRSFRKDNRNLIFVVVGLLWMGISWGGILNPWTLFTSLPFLENIHTPSRMLPVFILFTLLLLAKALAKIKNKKILYGFLIFLALESLAVKTIPFINAFEFFSKTPLEGKLIKNQTIDKTLFFGQKPRHYLNKNTSAVVAYEPPYFRSPRESDYDPLKKWMLTQDQGVKFVGHPYYKGEVYYLKGNGMAELESAIPGQISFQYAGNASTFIQVNTHALGGWVVKEGEGRVVPHDSGLLTVETIENQGKLTLRYSPPYINTLILFFVIGLGLFFTNLVRIRI